MPYTTSGAPRIYYETHGDAGGRPLVLLSGLGAQILVWKDAFVKRLTDAGYFVVRIDNRDVGLSDMMGDEDQKIADYTVRDIAADAFRVMDELGIRSAHVSGESMGGALAQLMAIMQPDRVKSLVLFYTAPAFDPRFVTEEIREILAADAAGPPEPLDAEQTIEALVLRVGVSASTDYPFDVAAAREMVVHSLQRNPRLDGVSRQGSAVATSVPWLDELVGVSVPTAIIHGRSDRLVKVDAALELAQRIAKSELHIYPDMGHEIAPPLWDEYLKIFVRTTGRAAG